MFKFEYYLGVVDLNRLGRFKGFEWLWSWNSVVRWVCFFFCGGI